MTTYAFPNIRPSMQEWILRSNTAVHQSPFNEAIETLDRDGEHWAISMAFEQLQDTRRAELLAFLFKLNGAQHRFTVQDFSYSRLGAGGGSPIVNGAGQTGKSLNITSGPASQTNWLRAGDKISVAGLLHSVDADVDTAAGGTATILVSPRIFAAPANSAPVEIDTPTNSFALISNSLAVMSKANESSVSFEAVSAL